MKRGRGFDIVLRSYFDDDGLEDKDTLEPDPGNWALVAEYDAVGWEMVASG